MTMTRIIALVAGGLALGACSGGGPSFPLTPTIPLTPNFDNLSMKPVTGNLKIQSDPPGAEARTSQGLTCRTPCTLAVPLIEDFTVSYDLNGYAPQSVSVRPMIPWAGAATVLEPNPVSVQLISTGPGPQPPRPAPPRKRRPDATAAAPVAAAPPPPPNVPQPYPLAPPFPPPAGTVAPPR